MTDPTVYRFWKMIEWLMREPTFTIDVKHIQWQVQIYTFISGILLCWWYK